MITTELHSINRTAIWISYIPCSNENGSLNDQHNKEFTCFYSRKQPDNYYGKPIKDEHHVVMKFPNIEDARKYAIRRLETIVYPPDFLNPLNYETTNIREVMFKPMLIKVRTAIFFRKTIKGKIMDCLPLHNESTILCAIYIQKENGTTEVYSLDKIKSYRNPNCP